VVRAAAGISLAPEQRQAIGLAVRRKVLVITGGPGTGKTTLINGIIQILEKKTVRFSWRRRRGVPRSA